MLSAYQQLRSLCSQIRHDTSITDESSLACLNNSSTLPLGHLNEAVLEVKGLCLNLMNSGKPGNEESSNCGSSCPFCSSQSSNGKRVNEDMTLALTQKEAQIRKRDEQIASLQSQVT